VSRGKGAAQRRPRLDDPERATREAEKRRRRAEAGERRRRQARLRLLRRRLASVGVAIAVVVGVGLLGAVLIGAEQEVTYAGDLRVGGRLEQLALPRLEGEGRVELASFGGRPIVINFFASWCPNCVAEMPDFERVHQELGDRVGFLGISQQDAPRLSVELAHETGITYPAGVDERGEFFTAIGGRAMPTTVFVRAGGEIAFVQVGALDADGLRDAIGRYLDVRA
jgi:thiol-disulfide isomerase/thioredoxin